MPRIDTTRRLNPPGRFVRWLRKPRLFAKRKRLSTSGTGRKRKTTFGRWHMEPISFMDMIELLSWHAALAVLVWIANFLFGVMCKLLLAPAAIPWHMIFLDACVISGIVAWELNTAEEFLPRFVTGITIKRRITPQKVANWLGMLGVMAAGASVSLFVVSVVWAVYDKIWH